MSALNNELAHDWGAGLKSDAATPMPAKPPSANPARGEAALRIGGTVLVMRPSFAALVAAEGEIGPLFALVERAAAGTLSLTEMTALFWHCLHESPPGLTRAAFSEGVAAGGLAAATPALRVLMTQILAGR